MDPLLAAPLQWLRELRALMEALGTLTKEALFAGVQAVVVPAAVPEVVVQGDVLEVEVQGDVLEVVVQGDVLAAPVATVH